ncbi:MAG: hypothetical protein WCY11_11260, partial [Novosphingobium sp.]
SALSDHARVPDRVMRGPVMLLVVLALAGCGSERREEAPAAPAPRGATPSPAVPASAPPQLPAPATLAGEWRVAGIDGKPFNETYGLALSANDREVWWEPRCAGMARGYAIEGNGIRFGWAASRGPQPQPGKSTETAVCEIGLPPRLADVMRALDAGRTVVVTPSNGVEISGGGHSVLLFSQ